MNSYQVEYGEDVDGNRGQLVFEHEIEESDYDNIREQILEFIEDNEITTDNRHKYKR